MQLKVSLPPSQYDPDNFDGEEITVTSFRQIVSIGAKVSAAVREWLRQIPMTPQLKTRNFMVSAEWIEDEKKPAPAPARAARGDATKGGDERPPSYTGHARSSGRAKRKSKRGK